MSAPRKLFEYAMRTADDRVVQCPAGKRWIVTSLFACNTAATATTFRLHHAYAGRASATSNALFYDVRIAANTTVELLEVARLPMNANEDLRGLASAANITLTGYGYEEDA